MDIYPHYPHLVLNKVYLLYHHHHYLLQYNHSNNFLAEVYYNVINNVQPVIQKRPTLQAADPMYSISNKWIRFKDWFTTPELRADMPVDDKIVAWWNHIVNASGRVILKYMKGRTLDTTEVANAALKNNVPRDEWSELEQKTLTEAYDWMYDHYPSGFEKTVGEVAEFMGRLSSVSYLAAKIGIIGNTPKDISTLQQAAEVAKQFALVSGHEELSKVALTKIDPTETEYGYEGPASVLRDMAIGAIFSFGISGASALKAKLTPDEYQRAMKAMGMKPGYTEEQFKTAYRELVKQYHPDKVAGMAKDWKKLQEAREVLTEGVVKRVGFRKAQVTIKPRLLTEPLVKPKTIHRKAGFMTIPETPTPEALKKGAESVYQSTINKFAAIENVTKKQKASAWISRPEWIRSCWPEGISVWVARSNLY